MQGRSTTHHPLRPGKDWKHATRPIPNRTLMCAMVDLQVVTDEVMVGVLLDANEKIVEAIQLYDKVRTKLS